MRPDAVPKPGSLEAKFRLMLRLPLEEGARRKHIVVFGFILDWWHKDYGNALASLRHIVGELERRAATMNAAKGIGKTHVSSALADLKEWGYLNQLSGGKRGTGRYTPNWDLVCTVHNAGDSHSDDANVHTVGDTVSAPQGTVDGLTVHNAGNKDPSTPTRFTEPGTGIDGADCAAPTAPLADGLAAAAAETAQGFEKLWSAYGLRRGKKEARTEFDKLDICKTDALVASATAWREAWAAQGKADAPRKSLATWLRCEHWDEEPPTGYHPKERRAKTPKVAPPATPPPPLEPDQIGSPDVLYHRAPQRISPGDYSAYVAFTDVHQDGQHEAVWLHVALRENNAFSFLMTIADLDPDEMDRGNALYSDLLRAIGLTRRDHIFDLCNRPFTLTVAADGALGFETLREHQ